MVNEIFSKIVKNKKNVIVVFFLIFTFGALLIIGNTFGVTSYKVVFNRAENTEIMKTCKTDEYGKLNNDCISAISTVCNRWSPEVYIYDGYVQKNQIAVSEFANMTFTEDTNYYCVAHSSLSGYKKGCYVCKDDSNIMKWKFNTSSDDDCPSGYSLSSSITAEENCESIIPDSCYVCSNNSNIMKWDNNGDVDNNCSSGYVAKDISQNECKTIIPDSCYVCNGDSNIMKWDNSGEGDSECPSGYTSKDISQNECKTIIPDSCYVCNDNSNIVKWDNSGEGDGDCLSGYTAKNIPQNECKPIVNPPTGSILMFLVWIVGIGAIIYSMYYYRNIIRSK